MEANGPLSSEDIGFKLAPRLNAAGRLGQATLGVELLTTESAERAEALAAYLHRDIMPYPWDVIPVFVQEIQGDLWHHTVVSAGRESDCELVAWPRATPRANTTPKATVASRTRRSRGPRRRTTAP